MKRIEVGVPAAPFVRARGAPAFSTELTVQLAMGEVSQLRWQIWRQLVDVYLRRQQLVDRHDALLP